MNYINNFALITFFCFGDFFELQTIVIFEGLVLLIFLTILLKFALSNETIHLFSTNISILSFVFLILKLSLNRSIILFLFLLYIFLDFKLLIRSYIISLKSKMFLILSPYNIYIKYSLIIIYKYKDLI